MQAPDPQICGCCPIPHVLFCLPMRRTGKPVKPGATGKADQPPPPHPPTPRTAPAHAARRNGSAAHRRHPGRRRRRSGRCGGGCCAGQYCASATKLVVERGSGVTKCPLEKGFAETLRQVLAQYARDSLAHDASIECSCGGLSAYALALHCGRRSRSRRHGFGGRTLVTNSRPPGKMLPVCQQNFIASGQNINLS